MGIIVSQKHLSIMPE